ncbi:FecR family protein [Mariniflexile sp. HNIBRBA6329]|uniref:FecR family protein n=1 Tax=Mariniflexile sp. HNIBRBA6329 TaxID=3373088 RepID=UPI003745BDEF
MITPSIENLIVKFLSNQATASELDALETWIQVSNNDVLFKQFVKINYAIEFNMQTFNINKAKDKLLAEIASDKRVITLKNTRKKIRYAAAAIVIGILATGYFFKDNLLKTPINDSPEITNTIEAGTNKATLTLEDGSVILLEKGDTFQTQNANSNGEKIVYTNSEENSKTIKYNYLTIPRGGQFFIKLSDGTKVWLNSESQLKYPVNFKKGDTRQVELVYGEAYFDVSPSTKHNGAKFKVLNKSQEIEVLGTMFNVKSYKDETNIYTTLVEGKVEINTSKGKQLLAPNQQSNLDIILNKIAIKEVNTKEVISWIHGDFVFQNKPLKDIIKVLSRWYDIEIEIENKSLEDIKFNGELSKYQNLEDILLLIKNTNYINNYETNTNKVILK